MTRLRAGKIAGMAADIPELQVDRTDGADMLVLGWGSTYGAIHEAVRRCRTRGLDVSHAHLNYLNPLPRNLGELLKQFGRVLIPELNLGQLVQIVRSRYLVPAESMPKIQGQPFRIDEIEEKIRQIMES